MDDDSTIEAELDSVVGLQDKFIGGKEPYNFDDRCYRDDYVSESYQKYIDIVCFTKYLIVFVNLLRCYFHNHYNSPCRIVR